MTTRLPRAREAPLPELAKFLAPFEVHCTQRPSAKALERSVTGLLTEHPTKNCATRWPRCSPARGSSACTPCSPPGRGTTRT